MAQPLILEVLGSLVEEKRPLLAEPFKIPSGVVGVGVLLMKLNHLFYKVGQEYRVTLFALRQYCDDLGLGNECYLSMPKVVCKSRGEYNIVGGAGLEVGRLAVVVVLHLDCLVALPGVNY